MSRVLLLAVVAVLTGSLKISAQTRTPPAVGTAKAEATLSPKKDEAKPSFKLTVNEENVLAISLQAENSQLSEIAADLSRKLKIPVVLSPVMAKQRTGAKFTDLLLEPAMQLLAPVVFVDYEIDSAPGARPRPLGVFLNAYNETPPATNAVVKFKSQAFVISGNTEATADSTDENAPIKVSSKNGRISVTAKDQPLVDVMASIADEAGIPFEGPEESDETVSVDIKDRPLEDAILPISPNLQIYVRFDSEHATRTVLRMVVVVPQKKP